MQRTLAKSLISVTNIMNKANSTWSFIRATTQRLRNHVTKECKDKEWISPRPVPEISDMLAFHYRDVSGSYGKDNEGDESWPPDDVQPRFKRAFENGTLKLTRRE